jgi:hypothetical protein
MSWTRNGDLICDCCGRVVIKNEEINEQDLKENTDQTVCNECWEDMLKYQPETD